MTKISAARAKRLAEIYVFEHSGNQRASWRQLLEEEHVDYSETTINNAWREFQQPKVKEWIQSFKNRRKNSLMYARLKLFPTYKT